MSKAKKRSKPRRNVFVKVSGDMIDDVGFLSWIEDLSYSSWVVICVGAGTQINEEFEKRGFPVKQHGPLGRECENFEQRQVARQVLEDNQQIVQDQLAEAGIHVSVAVPVMHIGDVLCHINGDLMVQLCYLGFDQLYVVTTAERVAVKEEQFAHLPKVEIKAF